MSRKKTKIVATISDKKCDVELLRKLYDAGMNVVRINTAHQSPVDSIKVINNVREVSEKIAILLDTKGPEVRTNKSEPDIKVTQGQRIKIRGNPAMESNNECLYVSYKGFVDDVPEGSNVLIDDGDIELKVVGKNKDALLCEVCNSGIIKSRKSVNVPKVYMNLPSLSDKDRMYVHFAVENNLDFIAHSFVRSKEDVREIQEILDKHCFFTPETSKVPDSVSFNSISDNCTGI
ncbi:Pyruvate kinase I [subsurface metagenome]